MFVKNKGLFFIIFCLGVTSVDAADLIPSFDGQKEIVFSTTVPVVGGESSEGVEGRKPAKRKAGEISLSSKKNDKNVNEKSVRLEFSQSGVIAANPKQRPQHFTFSDSHIKRSKKRQTLKFINQTYQSLQQLLQEIEKNPAEKQKKLEGFVREIKLVWNTHCKDKIKISLETERKIEEIYRALDGFFK
jgi:hypothetical protein